MVLDTPKARPVNVSIWVTVAAGAGPAINRAPTTIADAPIAAHLMRVPVLFILVDLLFHDARP
jgi:hypothetical protein